MLAKADIIILGLQGRKVNRGNGKTVLIPSIS